MIPPPPAIHESFTPLPCPKHQVSTLDIEGCIERIIVATDRQIDRTVRTISGILATADGKRALVRSEVAWLAYRRASCEAASTKYAGGTLAAVVDAGCQAERNRAHLRDLADLKKTLTTP
jgi:uncharacterized protein YecT (DUF1311 family)